MAGGFQGSGFGDGFQTEEIVSLDCNISNQSSLAPECLKQTKYNGNVSNISTLAIISLDTINISGDISNVSSLAAECLKQTKINGNISNVSTLSPSAIIAIQENVFGNIGNESSISVRGNVITGAIEKIGAFSSAFFSPDFFDTNEDVTLIIPDLRDWSKKSTFLVNGSPDGDFENYQVKVAIPYQSFMQSNFGDIRFTLSDSTFIPYYLQSYVSGVSASFILSIPSIPEGTANSQEITVYAGNSSVTTTSNPAAVYVDYDNFDNTLTDWTFVGGNWSELNNQLIVEAEGGTVYAYLTGSNFGACIIEVDVIPDSNFRFGIIYGGSNTNPAIYDVPGDGFGFNNATHPVTLLAGTKYHLALEIKPNGVMNLSCNGVLQVSTTESEVISGYVGLRKWNQGQAAFENFSISQTTNNPPVVGALGSSIANVIPPVSLIGAVSNVSSLSPEAGVKYSLKSTINNISGLSYQETGELFLKCMMAENSIIRGNTGIKSHLGMMASSLATLYPIINGDHVYVKWNVSNNSNLLATLPLTIFYDIENINGDMISSLSFEPIYQGAGTAVQPVVLKSIEGNPNLDITITSRSSLAPQGLESSSADSYEYIQVSLTGDAGDWHSSINVNLVEDGSVTFYVQADIPENAVPGGWVCELTTTIGINGANYTQNLVLSGTTLTGNPVMQTAGVNNPPVIAEMADGNYDNITKFDIVDTVNAVVKTYELDYTAAEYWKIFESGQQIILLQGEDIMLNGTIQDVKESGLPGNHTFTMTGRDQAQALVDQSFSAAINCPYTAGSGGILVNAGVTFQQVLNMILADTPIQMGSTASAMIPNNYTGGGLHFCGSWSTKKIAIDYLLYLIHADGGPDLCWFVDNDGYLQTFDASNPGAVALVIPVSQQNIRSLDFDDNSENVVNQITAYGGTNNSIVVTVSDPTSIATYGLKEGPKLQDSTLTTQAEVQAAAEAQLALNKDAVWTATAVIPQFPGAVSGQPVIFTGHPKFGNTIFIISKVQRTGTQANYTTTITSTTDPNVISPLESFDMVQVVASNVVAQNLPVVGVAGDLSADGTRVTVQTVGGVVDAAVLNPVTPENNNSGGGSSSGGGAFIEAG